MTDLVVCPLCLDHFGREALLGDPPILSVEHPIPSAVEGEFKTLTCRKCNNTAGAILDSHFVQMIAYGREFAAEATEKSARTAAGLTQHQAADG